MIPLSLKAEIDELDRLIRHEEAVALRLVEQNPTGAKYAAEQRQVYRRKRSRIIESLQHSEGII